MSGVNQWTDEPTNTYLAADRDWSTVQHRSLAAEALLCELWLCLGHLPGVQVTHGVSYNTLGDGHITGTDRRACCRKIVQYHSRRCLLQLSHLGQRLLGIGSHYCAALAVQLLQIEMMLEPFTGCGVLALLVLLHITNICCVKVAHGRRRRRRWRRFFEEVLERADGAYCAHTPPGLGLDGPIDLTLLVLLKLLFASMILAIAAPFARFCSAS